MTGMRLAVAAVLLLALAGCSGGESSADPPADSPQTEASAEPDAAVGLTEATFLRMVRDDVPTLARWREDADLVDIGQAVCGLLQPGQTDTWVMAVKQLTDGGTSARQAGGFIVYSVSTYCPEKASALP